MNCKKLLWLGMIGLAAWTTGAATCDAWQEKESSGAVQGQQQEGAEKKSGATPPNLDGIKCCAAGDNNASADHAAAYRDGTVYFCCADCLAAFEKDSTAYATMANHQLVLTGQYEQKACPISGGELSDDSKTTVAGVEVGFCCDDCKQKVEAQTDATEQAKLVFGDEGFEKGFAKKATVDVTTIKCFFMKKKDLIAEKFVEFNDGKVYFCCDGCVKRFNKDPAKYAAMANHQMVQTGQYVQTGCPISGGKIDDTKTVEVNGVKVGFCCGNCQAKAEAASEEDRAELLSGAEAFAKGFTKK